MRTASPDAALVVGIEDYIFAPDIPGAKQNAGDWWRYFRSRNIPFENTQLLTSHEGTKESILNAAQKAAEKVQAGGTLWFVFIGHGAASMDGETGLLVGSDAQQNPQSLESRSVRQNDLDDIFSRSNAARIVIILDACFSGRTPGGGMLIPGLQPLVRPAQMAQGGRIVRLTAAAADEYAGPLPFGNRPAFSYLLLGALRGWADANRDGNVDAAEAISYARNVLNVLEKGRTQTPELLTAMDKDSLILSSGVNEAGPNLDAILLSNTTTNDNTLHTSPAAASAGQDADAQSADKNGKKIYFGAVSTAAGGVALALGTYWIVQYAKEPQVYDSRTQQYVGNAHDRQKWKLGAGIPLDIIGAGLVISGIVTLTSALSPSAAPTASAQNKTISDVSWAVMPTADGLNASVGFKF